MVDLHGQITPETEEEWELLQGLYEVTGEAKRNGVEDQYILASLGFVTSSIAARGGEATPDPQAPKPSEGSDEPEKATECPHCGEPIDDVDTFMGGNARVYPCGHEMPASNLEGWGGVPGEDS